MDSKQADNNTAYRDIAYAIRVIMDADGLKQSRLMLGQVTAVDEDNRTCEATITLGDKVEKLTDVGLSSANNDGQILFPAIDSGILICLMPDNSSYMIACEDITKVLCFIDANNKYEFDASGFIWNDGNNGGLVKVIELTQKVNNLENKLNTILNILKTTVIPLAPSGTYPFASLYAAVNALTPTVRADIENTFIKH